MRRDVHDAERAAPAARAVALGAADYPGMLAEIADPPDPLYLRGNAGALAGPHLAVVGARSATPQGRQTAARLASELAAAGLGVVSGLARGVDAAAHAGALAAGGVTVAALGTGVDVCYPARHRALAERIAATGALVSELPPGTPPRPGHFPRRNRIISGLCVGVLVVEAAERSGSLITARTALEQGREVFAVPGSVRNPLSRGCHALIRAGAVLVESAADVLAELRGPLGALGAHRLRSRGRSLAAERVLRALSGEPSSSAALAARTGVGPGELAAALRELEADGRAALGPGGWRRREGG